VALKLVKFKICDKRNQESVQMLLQTQWHIVRVQINLISLGGDSFTIVGYIIVVNWVAVAFITTSWNANLSLSYSAKGKALGTKVNANWEWTRQGWGHVSLSCQSYTLHSRLSEIASLVFNLLSMNSDQEANNKSFSFCGIMQYYCIITHTWSHRSCWRFEDFMRPKNLSPDESSDHWNIFKWR